MQIDRFGFLFILMAFSLSVSSQSASERWIVKTKQSEVIDHLQKRHAKNNGTVKSIFKALNLYLLELETPIEKSEVIDQVFRKNHDVEIFEDFEIETRHTPNDPDFPGQWGMSQIGMQQVWDITRGGKAPNGDDIVIAIFDDGFDVTHRDYASNIWINNQEIPSNGIDEDNNGYIDDYLGWNATTANDIHRTRTHGTAVAGIIGAIGDNSTLIAGVNWNVKLMLTSGGRNDNFSISDIVKAYQYIYIQRKIYNETRGVSGAYVVASNYSGGAPNLFPEDFPSWCEIYDLLGQEGVINFTSAPNADVNVDMEGDLPSTCPSDFLIVVTNTDRFDNKVSAAGYGPSSIDLGAPGEEIVTTAIQGELNTNFSGASASAPFVAGVASLLYSVICDEAYELSLSNPSSMALEVRKAILRNVTPSNSLGGITTTGGRLDALSTLDAWRNIKDIGDCCEISISNINIEDITCQNADDGSLSIAIDTIDIRGGIIYSIVSSGIQESNKNGNFDFLMSGLYDINIMADRDLECIVDSTVMITESLDICIYGDFQIETLSPNPTSELLSLKYELDEIKNFEVVIYNYLGQLLYTKLVKPTGSGRGVEVLDISAFPQGNYYVAIRSNDLLAAKSFQIIR